MTSTAQAFSAKETVWFPTVPGSVADARAWLVGRSAELLGPGRADDLALALSEVVTNAVRHGGGGDGDGRLELSATPKPGFLCVQVTDAGPGFVPRPRAMASEPTGGYGLFLVERLTRRWGITREAERTRVWFEFDYASSR